MVSKVPLLEVQSLKANNNNNILHLDKEFISQMLSLTVFNTCKALIGTKLKLTNKFLNKNKLKKCYKKRKKNKKMKMGMKKMTVKFMMMKMNLKWSKKKLKKKKRKKVKVKK